MMDVAIRLTTEQGIVRQDIYDLFKITCNIWYCVHDYFLKKNDAIIAIVVSIIAYDDDNANLYFCYSGFLSLFL